ncbi:hypothetical protein C8F01DRAFT_1125696 [Mycena amicta]|nr:hypothetical protein C8F01DRAFT_1125696 [Mycena amicta]
MQPGASLPELLTRLIGMPSFPAIDSGLRAHSPAVPTAATRPFTTNAELEEFRVRFAAYLSLFSPIRRLPEDVLVEIFEYLAHSLDTLGGMKKIEKQRVAHAPVRALSHVCASWRAIVLRNRSLWNRMDVQALEMVDDQLASEQFRFSMERSQGGFLDIRLQHASQRSLEILGLYISRCKILHITTLRLPEHVQCLSTMSTGQVTHLKKLRLVTSFIPDPVSLRWMVDTPKLKNVSVSGTLAHLIPTECLERLKNLTCTTYLEYMDINLAILSSLPSKLHYHLVFYPGPSEAPETLPPITSNIQQLSFGAGNLHKNAQSMNLALYAFQSAMCSLTLPDLHTFSFEKAASGDGTEPLALPWPHEAFLDLSVHSAFTAHLRVLDLVAVNISLDQLEECLETLAALETLSLSDHPQQQPLISTSFLDRLMVSRHKDPLVPHLCTLSLHSRLKFVDAMLLSLLRSRVADERSFACHVYALRGSWTGEGITASRRQRIMNGISDLRAERKLKFSFSSV